MSSLVDQAAQTKMTNPPKQLKMVKIKTIYPIRVMREGAEVIVKEGNVVEVTEDEAKEFCDKEFKLGYKDIFGNVDPHAFKPKNAKRAERV